MSEPEEIVNARKILDDYNYKDRKQKEFDELMRRQTFIGRYFKDIDHSEAEGHINVYRIFEPDKEVQMERWVYYGTHHYKVEYYRFFQGGLGGYSEFDKEITPVEFYHAVANFLKKINVYFEIIKESDH